MLNCRPLPLCLAAMMLCWSGAAQAATVAIASVQARCDDDTLQFDVDVTGPTSSANADTGKKHCFARGSARAGNGNVGVLALARNLGDGSAAADLRIVQGSASAGASVSYGGILRSATGAASVAVPLSVNFSVSGRVSAFSMASYDDYGLLVNSGQKIGANLRFFGSVAGSGGGTSFEERAGVFVNVDENLSKDLPGRVTSDPILLRPNESFTVTFGLDASASGQMIGFGGSQGLADAYNSATFATSGNVFNLPTGYFVDFSEQFIVNNRYVPGGPVAAVPLPASSWALLVAMLGFVGLRRRST